MYSIPRDKANHYIMGQTVAMLVFPFANSELLPFIAILLVAVGKELYDMAGKGTPEPLDALYTVAGGLVPIFCVLFL